MRVPTCINKNCLKVYDPNTKLFKQLDAKAIKAYEFEKWHVSIPNTLQEICVDTIAKNWIHNPILDEIVLLEDRYLLLDLLPENLPLELTIPRIPDEVYWKKCYLKRWPKKRPKIQTNLPLHHFVKNGVNELNEEFLQKELSIEEDGSAIEKSSVRTGSKSTRSRSSSKGASRKSSLKIVEEERKEEKTSTWKKCYIEMHVQEYLENLKPENYDPEKMKSLCDLCGSYVEILRIDQMLCSENSPNKLPLNAIVTGFQNLRELSICFKQTYAKDSFSWNILTTTYQDIKLFAKGLERIRLQTLRITNSDIDCDKTIIILKALIKHDLEILDFSSCKVGNRGMIGIAKFILEHPVSDILLVNNRIGSKGITALAYALSQKSQNVQKINLRLNQISDETGNLLMNVISQTNSKLKWLSLASCGLSTNFEVCKYLKINKSLEYLDVSNNALGEEIGKEILSALQYNGTLTKLDTRMCKIPSLLDAQIQAEVEKNRYGRKKQTCTESIIQDFKWNEDILKEMDEILLESIENVEN